MFQLANHGTILLDEVGDLPPSLQAKLLRVLQDGEVRPVGSDYSVAVQIRVIASTNKDLAHHVEKGSFREDLFFRLQVIPIHLPPCALGAPISRSSSAIFWKRQTANTAFP